MRHRLARVSGLYLVCLVGCSAGGNDHANRYGQTEDTTIVTVCAPELDRPDWWREFEELQADGSIVVHLDRPSLAGDFNSRHVAGEYSVVAIATTGLYAGQEVSGSMILKHRRGIGGRVFTGNTELRIKELGASGLERLPDDLKKQAHGFWDPQTRSLEIYLGPSPLKFRTDTGVILRVFSVGPGELRGHWVDGSVYGPLAGGYFCARKRGR